MDAKLTFTLSLLTTLLVACGDAGSDQLNRGGGGTGDEAPGEEGTPDPGAGGVQCSPSKSYLGYGGRDLTNERTQTALGVDRARLKPFGALQSEYPRVLGSTPASLEGAAATFGQAGPRWYAEPMANSSALQSAYDIAFDGCLTYTSKGAEFAAAPDGPTAATQCGAMARKFWSKTPAPQEVQACVDMATKGAAKETDVRRKWAYACASVLTAAGFLTY
jgi:hypothetical protein